MEQSYITDIQRNPNFALFGQGVLVAVIDTGIDYAHKAFLHPDGTTRIISLWDQTVPSGTPPKTFTYGSEYNRNQINLALKSRTPLSVVPSVDEVGHGTALAGIIAGNSIPAQRFSGVVPQAELVVVKLKTAKQALRKTFCIPADALCYQETDLMLAVRYVIDVARSLNRPIAVCIGMGSSQGSHEGIGRVSDYFSYLSSTNGTLIVIGNGNEGINHRHFSGVLDQSHTSQNIELEIGAQDKMLAVEIWQQAPHILSLDITSPSGEQVTGIAPHFNECRTLFFTSDSSTVWVNNILQEAESGNQLILIRFNNATPGRWFFKVQEVNNLALAASVNAWLPAGDLISEETYFTASDPYTTLTSPASSRYSVSVTAYDQNNFTILSQSSRGYPLNGMIKPDFAAPGNALTCPLPDKRFGSLTGTGAAAAHATGIAAMLLEWAIIEGNSTTATGREIGRLMVRGAVQQDNVAYPNPIWGYGTVNIYRTFQSLRV